MLFWLNDSVADFLDGEVAASADSHSLDLLCLSASEGKHRITAQRETLRSLSRNAVLLPKSRAVLLSALSFVEVDLALRQSVSVCCEVVVSEQPGPSSNEVAGKRKITIPLKWIDDSSKVQATILLSENLTDAQLLEQFVPVIRHLGENLALPMHTRLESGGGNTTAELFDHFAKAGWLCICVVDSDKKAPEAGIGDTAKALSHVKGNTHPLGAVAQTIGRDLENALPNAFYRELFADDVNHRPTVEAFEKFSGAGEHEIRAHIDVRKGLTLRDIFKLGANGPAADFWNDKLPVVAAAIEKELSSFPCYATGKCKALVGCECRLLNGNSGNILELFVEFCNEVGHERVAKLLDDSTRDEWVRLGRLLFEWCCASERLRS